MKEWGLRVGWIVGLLLFIVGGLAYLIQFIWGFAFHDTLGWQRINYVDALGWSLVVCLLFAFIYLLKEDVR